MSTRLFARRNSQVTVTPGTDEVMMGISLPSQTMINNISVKVKMSCVAELTAIQVLMYAVEGWILPVHDVDAASQYDTLWDNLVPKDSDVQTLDLDTVAADSSSFYEPGEVDFSSLLAVGLRPERLYHRHRVLHAHRDAVFTYQDNESPFSVIWFGGDTFEISIRKTLAVHQPSVLVFGFASPSLDDTVTAVQSMLAENEWGQIKYIDDTLEMLMRHVLGLVETGAETPWEESTAVIMKHLDPDLYEEIGGSFSPQTFTVYTEAMIDHSVVGSLGKSSVSTGR